MESGNLAVPRDPTSERSHAQIERSGVPASTMTLDDFREQGPERLAELVALTYPPSFSHDEELPTAAFDVTAARARTLVTTWT